MCRTFLSGKTLSVCIVFFCIIQEEAKANQERQLTQFNKPGLSRKLFIKERGAANAIALNLILAYMSSIQICLEMANVHINLNKLNKNECLYCQRIFLSFLYFALMD